MQKLSCGVTGAGYGGIVIAFDDVAKLGRFTPTPLTLLSMTSDTPLQPTDFDALDALLDELRTRDDEIPQWEFCEGALAALVCCRRQIPPEEYLPVLLGTGDGTGSTGPFTTPQQAARFMALWQRRWDEVAAALDAKVESLEDKQAYAPEVLDVRGGVAELPEEERAAMAGDELPAFAQVWALGFMFVVENWPEDWAAPRDKEVAEWLDNALSAVVALTEDDTGVPTLSMFSENGPPSLSTERLDVYGTALWAVYDLRELWRTVGPKVQQVRKEAGPGRNDPCHCGSGKKFKKCHGA